MANLSKMRRDKLIAYIERLKQEHTDDESIILFNEIENALTEKRYGLVFEQHTEAVDDLLLECVPVLTADPERRHCSKTNLPWNFIIEGDNLQALYLLEKTHKGKVDCIYIDPPYNTGAKDWKYNNDYVVRDDDYRHSKWLSMMKSRLEIAKKLLNPKDSVLIVTIDEKEYLHLGCLLEEMFPAAKIQMVSSVINVKGTARENEFARVNEYIYCVRIGDCGVANLHLSDEWLGNIKSSGKDKVRLAGLMRTGTGSGRKDSPGCFYPIIVSKNGAFIRVGETIGINESRHNYSVGENEVAVWPIHKDGSEGRWMYRPDGLRDLIKKGYVYFGKLVDGKMGISYAPRGVQQKIEKGELKISGYDASGAAIIDDSAYVSTYIPGNQWAIASHNATEYGTKLLTSIIGDSRFTFPKSLYAVQDVIRFFVARKPGAIILDFFAGSGTTMNAVNLLNAEDGGNRRCIMVTNNEVSAEEAAALTAKGFKPGDPEWEKYGIAKYVTWPRTICSITGVDTKGNTIKGEYLPFDPDGESRPMSRGFDCNVKFFKCDWIPRVSEDSLSDILMEHIVEMIELENSIEVDGKRIVVVLSEEEADKIEANWSSYTELRRLYISRNVLLTTKQNELFNTVAIHTIPDHYFDIEMKEVGEVW